MVTRYGQDGQDNVHNRLEQSEAGTAFESS